jgi:hypothetical protein
VSTDQEAFTRAKGAWEQLDEVWERGDQHTPEGRRALQGLKEALDHLADLMREPED